MTGIETIITTYIAPGTRARRLDIRGTLDTSRASQHYRALPGLVEPFLPGNIAARFAGGVVNGCFGPAGDSDVHWIEKREEGTTHIHHVRLEVSPLPMEAFSALLGMAQYAEGSQSGLVGFQAIEENVVRVEEVDPKAIERLPAPTPRFPLVFPSHSYESGVDQSFKDARVVVTFAAPVTEETYARTACSLESWSYLLAGGFPAKRSPMSAGYFVDVSRHLPTEIVLEVEQLYGSLPAWHALLRALDIIDRELEPIERVEAY